MKQFIDRIMRKLDMRLVRASNLDRMIAQIQALQAELQQSGTAGRGAARERDIAHPG